MDRKEQSASGWIGKMSASLLSCSGAAPIIWTSTQSGRTKPGASMRRTLRICRNAWTRFGNYPDRPLPVLPLFDNGGKKHYYYFPLCRRAQTPSFPGSQEKQRSWNERAASPSRGAEKGVWGATPTSRNCGFRHRRKSQFRAFVGTKSLLAK